MKKTLLTIVSLSMFILNTMAINTYDTVRVDSSGHTKISIAYDQNTAQIEAGNNKVFNEYDSTYSATRIGFIMQGTTNCSSGTGFIYIATSDAKSWKSISDTLTFTIEKGAVSTSGYVTLKESLPENLTADSLYVVFAMDKSTSANKVTIDFDFSQFETRIAAPGEILAMPMPNMTLTLGELHPRINLKDYFISDDPLVFEIQNYGMQDDTTMNLVAKGVVLGDSLGFVTYNIGETGIYIMVKKKTTTTNQSYYEEPFVTEGYINVTVVKNDIIPGDCYIEITPTVKAPTCSDKKDGSIELAISGGVKPYSFRWNNQRTTQNLYNIGEGMYMVTVIDSAGCFAYAEEYVKTNFYPYFSNYQEPSACGAQDGTITVTCDDPTAIYLWSNGSTESTLTNIPAGQYSVTVTNDNGCSQVINTALNSSYSFYLYTNYETSIFNTDCDATDGAIYTMVSGGTAPYTYKWKNLDTITSYATNLGVGEYTITVTDANNCVASNTIAIESNSVYNYYGPEISSITISEETNNMIIFWQKPKTDYIDFYTLYRERNDAPGVYDTLGTISYKDLSVFVDQNVDPKQNSWRYKLSATDFCGNESKMSYSEYKSIHLNYNMANDNTITLQWDGYEGMAFDRYSIFKITKDGKVKVAEVSPFCTRYSEKLELGTIGYVVGVEFLDTIDITSYAQLKAESGPFSLAMSNIAELENVSTKDVSLTPNANVSVKQNTIVVDNPNKSSIAVYDILGHSIAKNTSRANYVTIPMAQKGIYLVIVGNEAFKVMIE